MGMPDRIALRCSAIVFRRQAVLLIHRTYGSADDWVLPGGSPRAGETLAACARREVREETGLLVDPVRVAFVLEAVGPQPGPHTVDIVFAATGPASDVQPEAREDGMEPLFVPLDDVQRLDLRPPLAGHLRGLLGSGGRRYAPYLANLWRPVAEPGQQGSGSDMFI
jgi:8-oxo-dGTP diphosphatase